MIKRAAAVVAVGFALVSGRMPAQTPRHHVVFVVTSPEKEEWETAMTLADHFLAGIAPATADVEVLAYGPAIAMMAKGTPTAASTATLERKGVHFVACENAMRAHHIPATELLPGVTSVPSGVVELVEKQEKGWAYVKVGQ